MPPRTIKTWTGMRNNESTQHPRNQTARRRGLRERREPQGGGGPLRSGGEEPEGREALRRNSWGE
eukprot:9402497-Alexandrium_andersonii.AAC.1